MWRAGHGEWGGWWWPGVVLMAVFMVIFVVVMVRMMRGTGMCGFRMGGSGHHGRTAPSGSLPTAWREERLTSLSTSR